MAEQKSTAHRIAEFGDAARARLKPDFDRASVAYPPSTVTLLVLKASRSLTVHAGTSLDDIKPIKTCPVLGQSGKLGPKLREGDCQVPEGIYRIEGLNPNSKFYVSLRLNYPNDFDLRMATADGRTEPGSDIYIHGGTDSVGCLAMGDPVIEELFTLTVDVGLENVRVIIAPDDLRKRDVRLEGAPSWIYGLYGQIRDALNTL
jgi:murein L,D-transpeptidase YafK